MRLSARTISLALQERWNSARSWQHAKIEVDAGCSETLLGTCDDARLANFSGSREMRQSP